MSSSLSIGIHNKATNAQSKEIYEQYIVEMKREKMNESFALKK